jgi:predicted DNA-binding transcriptional regulator YafY
MPKVQKNQKMVGLLKILNELNKGQIVLKELEQDMGLSLRTIQRYIRSIEDAGFPLYNPKQGSYSFVEGYSLQKSKLSDKEICLLVLIDDFVESLGNKVITNIFKSFKTRLLDNKETENPYYIKLQETIVPYMANQITSNLEEAINNRKYINITYEYEGKDKEISNLKPVKIVNFDNFWYLICLVEKDKKVLKFKVSQIKAVRLLSKYFKYNKKIDKVLKESKNIWFEMKRDIEIDLLVSKDVAKYFKEQKYLPLQTIQKQNADGSLILSCKVAKFEEIIPIIFQWFPYIKVISPAELVKIIADTVKKYQKDIK